jgi:hypothetical protein
MLYSRWNYPNGKRGLVKKSLNNRAEFKEFIFAVNINTAGWISTQNICDTYVVYTRISSGVFGAVRFWHFPVALQRAVRR